jgi:hypothetical protein
VKVHYIRQAIEKKIVKLQYCPTNELTADIFTKALNREKHTKHATRLGMTSVQGGVLGIPGAIRRHAEK